MKPISNDELEPGSLHRLVRRPDEPKTLEEWLWRLKRYEDQIFVRWQDATGTWRSVSLASLPPKDWAGCVARWMEHGAIPVRIRDDAERANSLIKPK